jgi:hypothetical protein
MKNIPVSLPSEPVIGISKPEPGLKPSFEEPDSVIVNRQLRLQGVRKMRIDEKSTIQGTGNLLRPTCSSRLFGCCWAKVCGRIPFAHPTSSEMVDFGDADREIYTIAGFNKRNFLLNHNSYAI